MNQDKSLVPAYILEILKNHSSEEHPLLHKEIGAMLESEYGIKMDRTTVSRNISTLVGAGLIETNGKGNGVYYDDREFDDSELRLLIHSVICNNAIPSRQAKDLIGRLCAAGGKTSGQGQHYYIDPDGHYIDLVDRWERSDNQELFRNIEIIDEAIMENVQIRTDYYSYGADKKLHRKGSAILSPYNITQHGQRYYLMATIANFTAIQFLRIHHMRRIQKLKTKMIPLEDTVEFASELDLGRAFAEKSYRMSAKSELIEFRASCLMMDEIVDQFGRGKDIHVSIENEADSFSDVIVNVRAKPAEVMWWALQHLDSVEILLPVSLRDRIRKIVLQGMKKYEPDKSIQGG